MPRRDRSDSVGSTSPDKFEDAVSLTKGGTENARSGTPGLEASYVQPRTGTAAAIDHTNLNDSSAQAIRTPGCSAPLTLITLAVGRIRDRGKKGSRLEAEITALKAALLDSNAELAPRLVGQPSSRDEHAAHAARAIYPYDVAREMGLGKDRSWELRLAPPLMGIGLLWIPNEDPVTHPDGLDSQNKIRSEQHPKVPEGLLLASRASEKHLGGSGGTKRSPTAPATRTTCRRSGCLRRPRSLPCLSRRSSDPRIAPVKAAIRRWPTRQMEVFRVGLRKFLTEKAGSGLCFVQLPQVPVGQIRSISRHLLALRSK